MSIGPSKFKTRPFSRLIKGQVLIEFELGPNLSFNYAAQTRSGPLACIKVNVIFLLLNSLSLVGQWDIFYSFKFR